MRIIGVVVIALLGRNKHSVSGGIIMCPFQRGCCLNGNKLVQLLDENFHPVCCLFLLFGLLYLRGLDIILQWLVNDGHTKTGTDEFRQIHVQLMMGERCQMVNPLHVLWRSQGDTQL